MEQNKKGPIGIELVRRGLISQIDINKACRILPKKVNILN